MFFRWQEKLKPFNCSVKAISVLTKAKTKNIHEFKYKERKSVNGGLLEDALMLSVCLLQST